MSGDGWDDLLAEAQARLSEQEERELGDLGESIDFDAEPQFRGRYRGVGELETKRGLVDVYLLWDEDGERRFAFQQAGLLREIEELRPEVGDEILILRGEPRTFEKDGEERRYYPYAVRTRPCSDPRPEEPSPPAVEPPPAGDDGLPFLCPGVHDTPCARAAAAATS